MLMHLPHAAITLLCLAASAPTPDDGLQQGLVAPVTPRTAARRAIGSLDPVLRDALALPASVTPPAPWTAITANAEGSFPTTPGQYLLLSPVVAKPGPHLLAIRGHGMVYVNGEPRTGDPYNNASVILPVNLAAEGNRLLIQSARGPVHLTLTPAERPAEISVADLTLPDALLTVGPRTVWAGAPILNITDQPIGLHQADLIEATALPDGPTITTPLGRIEPFSVAKQPVRISLPDLPADLKQAKVRVRLLLAGSAVHEQTINLRTRTPAQAHKRTFISAIDGSVQYEALLPASDPAVAAPGVVLALHGASVEGIGHVEAYSAKPDLHILGPTNRRPFGFDWEEWGRLDALEILGLALADPALKIDPTRVYLTGHSMGGHGTWHLGVLEPGRWAAVAPSAGWISFATYSARITQPQPPLAEVAGVSGIIRRAGATSETLSMVRNLRDLGVFIVHGDADDNVPASEARAMAEQLGAFHSDWKMHLQPGAGHWWDDSPAPGAACVDFPGIFELFARRSIDPHPASVRFTTVNPAVASTHAWATIAQQQLAGVESTIDLTHDREAAGVSGSTSNVARLRLNLAHAQPPVRTVQLDGQRIDVAGLSWPLAFDRDKAAWRLNPGRSAHDGDEKGPHRGGGFRHAWNRNVALVYGTAGTPEENRWAAAKARYDAETWWYRGNGRAEVFPDTAVPEAVLSGERNVILYGHTGSNRLWPTLLGGSPVQVSPGKVTIGQRVVNGEQWAVLLVRPGRTDAQLVGAVSASGPLGCTIADRLPVFLSGVGLPDALVVGENGARGAVIFGNRWTLDGGQIGVEFREDETSDAKPGS
ncbi:MAG: prolyl oligopeptidase family serine peptidase [bacterium]|jgi:dienelactone hydrolase|nr:prolyl oligopeptidase family serine peptidase [Planctomycetaceae bacterium]